MARHKREDAIDTADLAVQLGLSVLGVGALIIGAIGLGKNLLTSGHNLAGSLAFTAAGAGVLWHVARTLKQKSAEARSRPPFRPAGWTPPVFPLDHTGTPFPMLAPTSAKPVSLDEWTVESVHTALTAVDWYQFERLCAALLRAEGYEVIRQGTVQPDGSVELIADKAGQRLVAHCKHWRTQPVKEDTIHGLLASMAQFAATRGAIYTLQGCAAGILPRFPEGQAITILDGRALAARAIGELSGQQLDEILNPGVHHCVNCEAPMVCHEGTFRSLWGCSSATCPQCRATSEHTGA